MKQLNEYMHIFFDMDGTVTRSCTVATPEMKDALQCLRNSNRDVVIVSGQTVSMIKNNVPHTSFILGQNGNHAMETDADRELWNETLSASEKKSILEHIASIPRDWEVDDENDLVMDRGPQISYSLLGYHADKDKKEAFDPTGEKRKFLLEKTPFISETLEVKIGGTTTLDYIKKGFHKGFNIEKLITHNGWNKDDCLYIGDALYEGGNDEAVIGVIDTLHIANPEETLKKIQEILE